MDLEHLSTICLTLLDKTDVEVGLDLGTAILTLNFTAASSTGRVVFRCSRFWRFHLAKAGDDAECLFVGETSVSVIGGLDAVWQALREDWRNLGGSLSDRLFRVTTEGVAMIDILCEGFAWQLERPS